MVCDIDSYGIAGQKPACSLHPASRQRSEDGLLTAIIQEPVLTTLRGNYRRSGIVVRLPFCRFLDLLPCRHVRAPKRRDPSRLLASGWRINCRSRH